MQLQKIAGDLAATCAYENFVRCISWWPAYKIVRESAASVALSNLSVAPTPPEVRLLLCSDDHHDDEVVDS